MPNTKTRAGRRQVPHLPPRAAVDAVAPMKFSVTHLTRYEYEQAVAFSPHALYLRPRETPQHRVARFAFNIAPSFKLTHTRDLYDNTLTWLHLWDRSDTLSIRSEFEIET